MSNKDKELVYEGRDLEAMDFAVKYHSWILDNFRPYLGETVLEVGAGSGSFTELLAETEVKKIIAVEPSNEMYPLLEKTGENLGDRVQTMKNYFSEVAADLKKQKPSSAVYINVFEHIEDDKKELDELYSTLPKGGHLCIFVPANEYLMSDFDRSIGHFRRYNKAELVGKVASAGFLVVEAKRFDIAGVLPWYLKFTLMKSTKMEPGLASAYDKLVVPVMRKVEGAFEPPVGKNVLLVARKP